VFDVYSNFPADPLFHSLITKKNAKIKLPPSIEAAQLKSHETLPRSSFHRNRLMDFKPAQISPPILPPNGMIE
jgi:hypothetical protein